MEIQLSVIVPFYNEEKNLTKLHQELISVLSNLEITCEIVYVNDGSKDKSVNVLMKEISREKRDGINIILISLKNNFGQTAAVSAGIDNSKGKYVSFLDADLQNNPKDIERFYEEVKQGYDAVFGWRRERKDATLRSILSRIANSIIQKIFVFPFHDVGCSARIVKKEILEGIRLYGELHRIIPVLIYLRGAKITEIVVDHRERYKGKSNYGYKRILKVVIDIITVKFLSSYGTRPAYVFGSFGLGSMFISGVTLLAVVYRKLFLNIFVHRDPLFLIAIFFGLLGLQFVMMGLLAELQVRTYFESQKKPIYEIKNKKDY